MLCSCKKKALGLSFETLNLFEGSPSGDLIIFQILNPFVPIPTH